MPKVGLVTDSTCDLTPEWLEAHDVVMVPLTVLFGEESFCDWVDLRPEGFYEKLARSAVLPKTSQPSPAEVVGRLAVEELSCASWRERDAPATVGGTAAQLVTAQQATIC